MFITGLERTSDWGMAISDESSRSGKVELEIFNVGKPGVWCEWKSQCTASQRGPYRGGEDRRGSSASAISSNGRETTPTPDFSNGLSPNSNSNSQGSSQSSSNGKGTSNPQAVKPSGLATSFDAAMDVDEDTSASLHFGFKSGEVGYQSTQHDPRSQWKGPAIPQTPDLDWSNENPFNPTETVVIQRITARLNPFRGVRLKASAEPRKDNGRRDVEPSFEVEMNQSKELDQDQDPNATVTSAFTIGSSFNSRVGSTSSVKQAKLDPLNFIHGLMFETPNLKISLVSDSDCLRLLKGLVLSSSTEIEQNLTERFTEGTRVVVDENGVGSLVFLDWNEDEVGAGSVPVPELKSQALVQGVNREMEMEWSSSMPTSSNFGRRENKNPEMESKSQDQSFYPGFDRASCE